MIYNPRNKFIPSPRFDIIPTDIDQFTSTIECIDRYREGYKTLCIEYIKNNRNLYISKEIYNLKKIIIHAPYITIDNMDYVKHRFLQLKSYCGFHKKRKQKNLFPITNIPNLDGYLLYITTNHI